MINATQARMARAALRWTVLDLASRAKVSPQTIVRLEKGDELRERTLEDIRRAFETAGVEFPDDRTVRLRLPATGGDS